MGWIGNGFVIIGILCVGYKLRVGFLLGMVGSLIWAMRAYNTGQWDLMVIETVIIFLQAFSWYNWRQKDEDK